MQMRRRSRPPASPMTMVTFRGFRCMQTFGGIPVSVAELLNPCPKKEGTQFPVVEATIGGVHAAMLKGELTCRQLVTAYLQRISAYDKVTGMNSIASTNPNIMKEAKAKDKQLKKGE